MMIDPGASSVVDQLTPDDFWRPTHQVIFMACRELVERRVAIDFVSLKNHCEANKTIELAGGPGYIASLGDGVPRATNWPYYADILRDLRQRRAMLRISDQILAEVYAGDLDGQGLAQAADGWIMNLGRGAGDGGLRGQKEAVQSLFKDLTRRVESKGKITGITTGLTTLNEMTNGWQPGDLVIIAARPSVGKTALAACMALSAARAGTTVGFFSLEMNEQQVEYRFVSLMSGVMLFRILIGAIGSIDYARISQAMNDLAELPIGITDNPHLTFQDIRAEARRRKASHGMGLMVVDYVQLLGAGISSRNVSRSEELGDISRRFKLLAKELNIPILLLSQLNRAAEGREDQRPRMKDLRESGSLEQDADIVLMIHRPDHQIGGRTELILEKQRNGPTGPFEVDFEKETTTFRDAVARPAEDQSQPSLIPEEGKPEGISRPAPGRSRRHVRKGWR